MEVRCDKLEMHGMAGLRWACEGFGVLPNGGGVGGADAFCGASVQHPVLWLQPR